MGLGGAVHVSHIFCGIRNSAHLTAWLHERNARFVHFFFLYYSTPPISELAKHSIEYYLQGCTKTQVHVRLYILQFKYINCYSHSFQGKIAYSAWIALHTNYDVGTNNLSPSIIKYRTKGIIHKILLKVIHRML